MIIRNDNITEASLGSSSDLNAAAYISKLISLGGVVNSTVVNAVNNLFLDLKSNGLYDKVKRLYPMVGSTQSASSLEAKLTGRDIIWSNSGGVIFNSNGITCDGSVARNPASLPQTPYDIFGTNNNNISFSLYNRTSRGAESSFPISASIGGSNNYFQLNINYGGDHYSAIGKGFLAVPAMSSTGLFTVSRTSDTSQKLYQNGLSLGEFTTSGNSLTSSGVISLFDLTYDNYSFMSFNDGMNDSESLTYYNIVQDFQTALGRAV